jgi:hypothetical protein
VLLVIHEVVAWVMVLGNGLAGLWALGAQWAPVLRRRALWWFIGATQVVVAIQVVLGVAVQEVDDIEAPGMHVFYGFVALVSVGLVYSYRQQMKDRQLLLYGLGCLFIMGLGIRAMLLHL